MPNKATEVCNAIKAAQKAAGEIFSGNPCVSVSQHHMSVLLYDYRNLEQIPGDTLIVSRPSVEYPWRASKVYDGVEFYDLLTQEEYEAVRRQAS